MDREHERDDDEALSGWRPRPRAAGKHNRTQALPPSSARAAFQPPVLAYGGALRASEDPFAVHLLGRASREDELDATLQLQRQQAGREVQKKPKPDAEAGEDAQVVSGDPAVDGFVASLLPEPAPAAPAFGQAAGHDRAR